MLIFLPCKISNSYNILYKYNIKRVVIKRGNWIWVLYISENLYFLYISIIFFNAPVTFSNRYLFIPILSETSFWRERILSLDECRNGIVIISAIHRKIRRRSTKSIAINSSRDIGLSAAGLGRARKARRHGRKRANLDLVQTPGFKCIPNECPPHRRRRAGATASEDSQPGKTVKTLRVQLKGVELSGGELETDEDGEWWNNWKRVNGSLRD